MSRARNLLLRIFIIILSMSAWQSSFAKIPSAASNAVVASTHGTTTVDPTSFLSLHGGKRSVVSEKTRKGLEMPDSSKTLTGRLLTGWSVLSVLAILGNAIRRVLPIALQPLEENDLTSIQWGAYAIWAVYMAYAEGYKAFQLKLSPLIIRRAVELNQRLSFFRVLFAGPYCMGLFGATKKRMIIGWSISAGVTALVVLVKKLPYPWRSIVDGGVVIGLTYGALSISYNYLKTLIVGVMPDVDPCHDEEKSSDLGKRQ